MQGPCDENRAVDMPSVGLLAACLLLPAAGLVLYLAERRLLPVRARAAARAALAGLCAQALCVWLSTAPAAAALGLWLLHAVGWL